MKKGIILIVLAIIAIGYISCKKEKDYRDKWVGAYECEEIYEYWFGADNQGTEVYQTNVVVTVKGDSLLEFLERRSGESYEAAVNSNGNFIKYFYPKGRIKGNFIGDSLYMQIIPVHGLGYYTELNFKGKKLKNKKR